MLSLKETCADYIASNLIPYSKENIPCELKSYIYNREQDQLRELFYKPFVFNHEEYIKKINDAYISYDLRYDFDPLEFLDHMYKHFNSGFNVTAIHKIENEKRDSLIIPRNGDLFRLVSINFEEDCDIDLLIIPGHHNFYNFTLKDLEFFGAIITRKDGKLSINLESLNLIFLTIATTWIDLKIKVHFKDPRKTPVFNVECLFFYEKDIETRINMIKRNYEFSTFSLISVKEEFSETKEYKTLFIPKYEDLVLVAFIDLEVKFIDGNRDHNLSYKKSIEIKMLFQKGLVYEYGCIFLQKSQFQLLEKIYLNPSI